MERIKELEASIEDAKESIKWALDKKTNLSFDDKMTNLEIFQQTIIDNRKELEKLQLNN